MSARWVPAARSVVVLPLRQGMNVTSLRWPVPTRPITRRPGRFKWGSMVLRGPGVFGTVLVPERMYHDGLMLRGNPLEVGTPPLLDRGQIVWDPGTMSFATGDSPVNLRIVEGANLNDVTYTVVNDGGTGCVFGTQTYKPLKDFSVGTCTVQTSAPRAGYADWTSPEFPITISDDPPMALAWDRYAPGSGFIATRWWSEPLPTTGRVIVGGKLTPTAIIGAGRGAGVGIRPLSGHSNTGDICTVNSNTGEVIGIKSGTCKFIMDFTEQLRAQGRTAIIDSPTEVTVNAGGATVTTTAGSSGVCSYNNGVITGRRKGKCYTHVVFPTSPTRASFATSDSSIILSNATPDNCMVNPETGLVIGREGSQTCEVNVSFTSSVQVSETGEGVAYALNNSTVEGDPVICTFNSSTGVITGRNEGICTMILRFSDTASRVTFTDPAGLTSFAAAPAETCSIDGSGVVTPGATGDCTVSFSVAMASKTVTLTSDTGLASSAYSVPPNTDQTVCTYDDSTGILTGAKAGMCKVSFNVVNGVSVATFSPEGTLVSFTAAPAEVCSVAPNGVVTGKATGVCYVTLEVSKSGRRTWRRVAPIIVEPDGEALWRYRSESMRGGVVTPGICFRGRGDGNGHSRRIRSGGG